MHLHHRGSITVWVAVLAWIAFTVPAAAQTGADAGSDALFQPRQAGTLTFPTRDVDGLHDLYTGARRYNARGLGELILPPRIGADQRVPALVILHGSGGEWSGRGIRQAALLSPQGIAVFVVDSFEARGLGRGFGYIERLRRANVPDQVADAFAALDVLGAHPNIDADRIGVLGYSMGGMSAILTAYEEVAGAAGLTQNRFALHVSFYAPCIISLTNPATTGAPVVALWGDRDESTDRRACDGLIAELERGGSPVASHWLEGAAHGWNTLRPMTFYSGLPQGHPCRFVIGSAGDSVEQVTGRSERTDDRFIDVLAACSDRGYTIGYHAGADQEANRILLEAIEAHLR